MTGRVVCVGDLMVDVVAHLPGPLAVGSDTPAEIVLRGGGSAANTAAWLAHRGERVTFVGCVGNDELGRKAVIELGREGVDTSVDFDPELPTGTCIVLVDPTGERTMVPSRGANGGLGPGFMHRDLIAPGDWVHLSAYTMLNEDSREMGVSTIGWSGYRQVPVSVDASSAAPLAAVGRRQFSEWCTKGLGVAILFANLDEAAVLSGFSDPKQAVTRLARGYAAEAVVKLGADGAIWSDGRRTVKVAARKAAVVDTTGAGDAFAAGYLAAHRTGAAPKECLTSGVILAAKALGVVGGRPPAPIRD